MKRICKVVLSVTALVALAAPAIAANPKLTVRNAANTADVFVVKDDGTIDTKGGLYYDATTKFLALGNTAPLLDFHITKDISVGGSAMFVEGIGNVNFGPNIAIRAGRGTAVPYAPTASLAGDIMGQVNFRGRGATNWASSRRSGFVSYATENYTDAAQGTNLTFVSTANGTKTPTEKLIIDGSGLVYVGQAMLDGLGAIIPPPTVTSNTKLAVVGDGIRITTIRTPASASAACAQGEISYDTLYVYVCIGNNSWKRSALTAW